MKLTLELRGNAGLQWVLERLSPLSPFGRTAARDLPWYGPGDEAALEEELDNVAGGGCQTKVDGEKYTVVTSGVRCFNGGYENNMKTVHSMNGDAYSAPAYTTDHMSLRTSWATFSSDGCCGFCRHLKFKNGLGYCGKSAK